jgi:predicted AAA+ superfamily ATPase
VPKAISHYPRYLTPRLRAALEDTPAVLIHGPRQCGKTTLARMIGERRGYKYVSFDDDAVRAAARGDPIGFAAGLPSRSMLDEVQRVPEIFTSLKMAIDRRRAAGRYILTGSANVLLVPALADSLAGRMGLLRLHPLAQCELSRRQPLLRRTSGVFANCVMSLVRVSRQASCSTTVVPQ